MTSEHKKLWSWAGKLALVAIPAAISGFASYKSSKYEAEVQANASYTAVRAALETLQTNVTTLSARVDENNNFAHEKAGEITSVKDVLSQLIAKLDKRSSKPLDVDLDGIKNVGKKVVGVGAGGNLKPREPVMQQLVLPAKFEDMVQQYKVTK